MKTRGRWWVVCLIVLFPPESRGQSLRLEERPGQGPPAGVEIHGVSAGAFDASLWKVGTLQWLPDLRSPLIESRQSGGYRNVYAPSAVPVPEGWRVFYGAWDGVTTPNDRIYSIFTRDFLDFRDRRTVIEHGDFIHVCNVNVLRAGDGSFHMACTVYPDARGRNKPAYFSSPDGAVWNGSPQPYPARRSDIMQIKGYPNFADADVNGMNVLLREAGVFRLYFCDFQARGYVHRATSTDAKHFQYDGRCLASLHMVNDVRQFVRDDRATYLMALHGNGDRLWYALSSDGLTFKPERKLIRHLGDADRYIVSVGWVALPDRVLGLLYGAGPTRALNRNRIYARWLQKQLVITTQDGRRHAPSAALGPDRQIIPLGNRRTVTGRVMLLHEDGKTNLGQIADVTLKAGSIYQVKVGT